ncbi:hypothetical protein Tco_0455846 [Tanacetum coccineum]
MSRTIPPPLVPNFGNTRNPNMVENVFQDDNTNNTGTNNVAPNVVTEDLSQLLDSRGGSYVKNVPKFDVKDFTSWKDRFLVYLDGLEPYLLEILENEPFVPKSPASTTENILIKPQKQWSLEDKRLANQDKRLKSIIIYCLLNDVMKSVIKCVTAKSMWNDLILSHYGPSDTRDTKLTMNHVEEDTRNNSDFLTDLNAEFHDRALLANQKIFYKRSVRVRTRTSTKLPMLMMSSMIFDFKSALQHESSL